MYYFIHKNNFQNIVQKRIYQGLLKIFKLYYRSHQYWEDMHVLFYFIFWVKRICMFYDNPEQQYEKIHTHIHKHNKIRSD